MAQRELETFLTLILADQNPELAQAHDELYPERVPEGIPLSLTLLYPFAAPSQVEQHYETLRRFFGSYEPFDFRLARLEQWDESGAVYAAPEPEQPLRDLMRALWQLFPQFPPYGVGGDPPPHASLTDPVAGDRAAARARVEQRLAGLLPAPFHITEVTLMEEFAPDRCRVTRTFSLGQR